MGPLDSAAKAILHEVPEDLVGLTPALAGLLIREVKADDTVLSAFSLTMDKLLHVELEGEEEPFSLHVEVEASYRPRWQPLRTTPFQTWTGLPEYRRSYSWEPVSIRRVKRRGAWKASVSCS